MRAPSPEQSTPEPLARPERVAVIAIHGVADQKAGDTARAIASLMLNHPGPGATYRQADCDSHLLPVPPLTSMVQQRTGHQDKNEKAATEGAAAQKAYVPPVRKAMRQSKTSDFSADDWISTAEADDAGVVRAAKGRGPLTPRELKKSNPDIAFSDYLLFKSQRAEPDHEAYEATRVRMTRDATDAHGQPVQQRIDVHEMYWADLSRLPGSVARIVAELFTIVFRLSQLGRDAVDRAAEAAGVNRKPRPPGARRWACLASLQTALDWAFANLLANLFLQLLLVGLVIAGLGGLARVEPAPHALSLTELLRRVLAVAVPVLAIWWYCYQARTQASSRIVVGLYALLAGWFLWALVPAHWVVGVAWLALLAALADRALRIARDRFPAARTWGLGLMALTAAALLVHVAINASAAGATDDLRHWVRAGMRVVEYLLLGVVAWWGVAGVLLIAWLLAGETVPDRGAAARASIATGRLGLFVSVAAFVALSMVSWAVLTNLVELGAKDVDYAPFWFGKDVYWADGANFLHSRYEKSTQAFALTAGLTLSLLAYLVAVLVPSLFAELRVAFGTSQGLGRWLGAGYRRLDRFVAVLTSASVVVAFAVALLLVLKQCNVSVGGWIDDAVIWVSALSQSGLKPLIFTAATLAAAVSLLGGFLTRTVPGLRMPLDVALDVDGHFREFPRRAIPRARIFSRYVSLLEHVAAQGYDRIVIVAHSQGTVISTELLRYLQFRAAQQVDARVTDLWAALNRSRLLLLTAGCPLRQLYAARFPHLYGWVTAEDANGGGPSAAQVGVARWVNLYTAGDYVGRWLWGADDKPYEQVTTPPAWCVAAEHEACLGLGAHTHYFDLDQAHVARWIDWMVTARP
ncbi:hypothetical protein BKP43_53940 [Variovorax boronicumulans]|uniref:hypothetical protein n=1 Tax=Variovorax boronicumulans TaxID=436515 RepID=UPI000BB3D3F7|nr:hypothetical protein [Variovorax boronicumulans]PBI84394.1 hypothetical protein BKP43_53940 [Variovorax boronicumulans]